jgi:hypothetical protein
VLSGPHDWIKKMLKKVVEQNSNVPLENKKHLRIAGNKKIHLRTKVVEPNL